MSRAKVARPVPGSEAVAALVAARSAKPVVLSTTAASAASISSSIAARQAGSLSEATATGSGFSPRAMSTSYRASNTAVLPFCR